MIIQRLKYFNAPQQPQSLLAIRREAMMRHKGGWSYDLYRKRRQKAMMNQRAVVK